MSTEMECRSCKEKIVNGAKWCPHCQRPQSIVRAFISPQALIITLILVGGYWYLTFATMEKALGQAGGTSIYETHEQLEIVESSFSLSKQGCEACVYVIGIIKNATNSPWSNIHFQAAFMDSRGKTIDVINDEDSDFVLGPNSEGKFKISGKAVSDFASYESHTVKITKANPDSQWY